MVLGVTHTVQMAAMREPEETTSMHSSQFVSVVTATYGSSQLSDAVANDWIVSTSTDQKAVAIYVIAQRTVTITQV